MFLGAFPSLSVALLNIWALGIVFGKGCHQDPDRCLAHINAISPPPV